MATNEAQSPSEAGEYTHAQVLTILSGLLLGHVPGRARPDDRQHVDPHDRRRPVRPLDPGLGDHGVPDHLDDHHADLRQARRPLRPQEAVHVRDLGLHHRLGDVRLRELDVRAGGVPCVPGDRRRRPLHAGAGDHRRHRVAAGARQVHRLLHGDVRHLERARSGHRRLLRRAGGDPRRDGLALGLPRQRPDRHRRPGRGVPDAPPQAHPA